MNRNLVLVAISLFLWGIGEGSFLYFQPIYLQELGAAPLEIGAILGGVGIAMTVAHIPAGYLSDKFGSRLLLRISWMFGLMAAWFMALASSLEIFVVGMVLYGLTAFVMSPLNSYITSVRGKISIGRALSIISASFNGGAVIGPLIGGYLGNNYELKYIYIFAALIFCLSNILIYFVSKQKSITDTQISDGGLLKNKRYLIALGLMFIAVFSMYLPQPLSPNFMQNIHNISISEIGKIGSIASLGNVILTLSLGSLNPVIGIIIGQAVVIGFSSLMWKGTGFSWFALGYFMLGGYRATRTLAVAKLREFITATQEGLGYGIAETVMGFAIILAPPLSGFLYEFDPVSVYKIAILFLVISIIVSSLLMLHKGKAKPLQVSTSNIESKEHI